MSHHTNGQGFIPSTFLSQPGSRKPSFQHLPNPSTTPKNTSSSHLVLSDTLIPRDYLNVRKPSFQSNASAVDHLTLPSVPEEGSPKSFAGLDSQTDLWDRENRYTGPNHQSEQIFIRQDPFDHDGLRKTRTTSPDSIETSASGESLIARSASVGTLPYISKPALSRIAMPRTSSIDSAISSMSTASGNAKPLGDVRDLSPTRIQALIATAGSAENLISHLLRDKKHAATQNNQLWKLVEKQRALLIGLNKDLERVTKERDRYRKKVKEQQVIAKTGANPLERQTSESPLEQVASSQSSIDEEPHKQGIQGLDNHRDLKENGGSLTNLNAQAAPATNAFVKQIAANPSSIPHLRSLSETESLRPNTPPQQLSLSIIEATPPSGTQLDKTPTSTTRKAPPRPLNLNRPKVDLEAAISSADEEVNSHPIQSAELDRGRRKTREDDDRDREISAVKQQGTRSRSKRSKEPKIIEPGEDHTTLQPSLLKSPAPFGNPHEKLQSLHPMANTSNAQHTLVNERLLAAPLRSPGLPSSPRPMNNMLGNSLPVSPRANMANFPLSPRAPKAPIPAPMISTPFTDPAQIQKQNNMAKLAQLQPPSKADRLQHHDPTSAGALPSIYRGLATSAYPNLLLPPNALPSIQVQVASSRLQPSRHSMLGLKTQEESSVFSLSIYSRASRNELWRIEKIPASLPHLDQQLKPRCQNLPKLPDRKLFTGQSPATIDLRRKAVDDYFEELLDVEVDEQAAVMICRFLSTDVLDPEQEPPTFPGVNQESLPQESTLNGKLVKTGYLTKKGKNFGGWKSRYFVMDSPELRYFESQGGAHLGTIRLVQAKIGSQSPTDATPDDVDAQYRHAFLVQEPKRKDTTNYIRHVLCAESDAERDDWVKAILHYVELSSSGDSTILNLQYRSDGKPSISAPSGFSRLEQSHSNDTSPGSAKTSFDANEPGSRNVSAPMNGAPIADSSQWGNKAPALQSGREKSHKMSNIFHFRKASQEQLSSNIPAADSKSAKPRVLRHNGYVRPVFGLTLQEAVDYCAPFNIDVKLPAVVYRSIEYLRNRQAVNEEGLFRLSGSNIVIRTLKERFNNEGDVDLVGEGEYYDVHAVASLFKTYLRELPSILLTRELHIEFLKVLDLDNNAEKVIAFNGLVHRLPDVNFSLLKALSEYLLEVTQNSEKNKMSVRNVGIVFSPTLNIPTPVFTMFLTEFNAIFGQPPGQSPQIQNAELEVTHNLSPADIRSPRRQMFSELPTPAYNQTSFPRDKLGFSPLQPAYETEPSGSKPPETVSPPRFVSIQPPTDTTGQYGSLNRMMVPNDTALENDKQHETGVMF